MSPLLLRLQLSLASLDFDQRERIGELGSIDLDSLEAWRLRDKLSLVMRMIRGSKT